MTPEREITAATPRERRAAGHGGPAEAVTVVVPAFNEERGIQVVLAQLHEVMRGAGVAYEILVVDDGSTDATAQTVERTGTTLLRHPTNRGYGATLKTGIRHASGEWILIIDADGTYPPNAIPQLLQATAGHEMVVGARTGAQKERDIFRRTGKWILRSLAGYLVEMNIPDLNSGLRVFRRETALRYFHLLPSNFSFTTTITLAMLSDNLPVKYVSIDYAPRIGRSKIRPLHDLQNFLLLIARTVVYFNPLKVFLPIAAWLCAIGLGVLVWHVVVYQDVGDVEVLALLIGLQIGFMGLLADVVVRRINGLGRD